MVYTKTNDTTELRSIEARNLEFKGMILRHNLVNTVKKQAKYACLKRQT